MSEPSVFERIARREIPAAIVAESERVIAFEDIAPQAPVHIVVTPKSGRYHNVGELADAEPDLLAELITLAHQVGQGHGQGAYRLIFNTGADAGQSVFHVHAHVLAGGLGERSLVG